MSSWLELLLLAIASMFWPTLIVIVVVALRLEHPVKILFWFLVGGLLTTVTVGIVIVFELQGAISSSSRSSVDPAVDITVGLLSLLAAYLLRRRTRLQQAAPAIPDAPSTGARKPSVAERAVGGGAAVAFAAGVLLNVMPGTFPIVALKDIAELDASDTVKIVSIIAFYVIMFTFVEVPIVSFQVAPKRTTTAMNKSQDWLARNKLRVAMYVLAVFGVYLVSRGIVDAIT